MEAGRFFGKSEQKFTSNYENKRKYHNLLQGSDNRQKGHPVPLCAGRHKMYLYTVKYSNFTRSALYIYIYLGRTRYVTAGL